MGHESGQMAAGLIEHCCEATHGINPGNTRCKASPVFIHILNLRINVANQFMVAFYLIFSCSHLWDT